MMELLDVLRACADGTRIDILRALGSHSELCVSDLVLACRVSQPKVSRHLAYLRREGVVLDRKDGLNVYYRLADLGDPDCRDVLKIVAHQQAQPLPIAVTEEVHLYEQNEREELDVELL